MIHREENSVVADYDPGHSVKSWGAGHGTKLADEDFTSTPTRPACLREPAEAAACAA